MTGHMNAFLGIDPGGAGGIAVISTDYATSCPMLMAGDAVDGAAIARWIAHFGKINLCAIELNGAMPGQGVSSMFKFGLRTGVVIGIVQALQIPLIMVRPQAWKKRILAGQPHDKAGAISWCRSRYPEVALVLPRCRTPHDGMADALCLAEYARVFT